MSEPNFRAGHVAIVGRPNVGKSTLVNALVGRKVTIVTAKPQTTRHRILGLVTRPEAQLVLVDTPGLHESTRRVMNQYMNRVAISSSQDADVIIFLIEALRFTDEDIKLRGAETLPPVRRGPCRLAMHLIGPPRRRRWNIRMVVTRAEVAAGERQDTRQGDPA